MGLEPLLTLYCFTQDWNLSQLFTAVYRIGTSLNSLLLYTGLEPLLTLYCFTQDWNLSQLFTAVHRLEPLLTLYCCP